MSPAPLPPHERAWRHPSELGPPEHEPTSTGGRLLIVSSATLSLVLVGLLAFSMTPDRSAAPDTTGAALSLPPPEVRDDSAATAASSQETAGPGATARPVPSVRQEPTFSLAETTSLVATTTGVSYPMLTPVGDDGFALASSGAVGEATTVEAQLPTGEIIDAEVLYFDATIAVVVLPESVRRPGLRLSARPALAPTDTVAVHSFGAAEPLVVRMRELPGLDIADGTPVTDAEGRLIGLCTFADHDVNDGIEEMSLALTPVATLPEVTVTTTPSTPEATSTSTSTSSTVTTSTTATTPTTSTTTSTTEPSTTLPATTVSATDAASDERD